MIKQLSQRRVRAGGFLPESCNFSRVSPAVSVDVASLFEFPSACPASNDGRLRQYFRLQDQAQGQNHGEGELDEPTANLGKAVAVRTF